MTKDEAEFLVQLAQLGMEVVDLRQLCEQQKMQMEKYKHAVDVTDAQLAEIYRLCDPQGGSSGAEAVRKALKRVTDAPSIDVVPSEIEGLSAIACLVPYWWQGKRVALVLLDEPAVGDHS